MLEMFVSIDVLLEVDNDVGLPVGITAFLRSHDPRFDPRPWCHALPKSEYEAAFAVSSHPLYALRPLISASWPQCAVGAAIATAASQAM